MMARPILRPIPCLRASFRIVSSLTGKTVPARSRAMTYFVIPLGTGARGAVDVRALVPAERPSDDAQRARRRQRGAHQVDV